jgi:SAM-dependent methyltransferase
VYDTDTHVNRKPADSVFTGAISEVYERHLVPLIFEPYADALSLRLSGTPLDRVLETAAGTGVVTRALAARLPSTTSIIATDLNQAMLDQAAATGTSRPVEWRQADAMALPFGDGEFDAVVCEFGVMFFPDKPKAFAEARRVLRDGGVFLFSVWDRIEDNEFADVVTNAVASMFPDDPPQFLRRTPHGYFDRGAIERDLAAGGFFRAAEITTLEARSRAPSPEVPAIAYCHGTPLRSEIEARDARQLADATDLAANALAKRFGSGTVDGKIQAHIVAVGR